MQSARDLPEDLALPLRSGAEWWYWLGGRPAVDLVNTLRERWCRRVETLVTPGDLGLWLVEGQLVPAPPRVTRALLGEARDLREAIDACMGATLAGGSAPRAAAREIDRWLVDVRPRLQRDATGALTLAERPPIDTARAALVAIALDAARMLGTPAQAARIRVCASETCSARFYDRSPAGRRRWCSMALCGNEAKARRHRARAKRAAAAGRGRAAKERSAAA